MSNPAQGAVGADTMTAGSKAVSARTLAGILRSRIERAAEHKSETVSLGQFFADQIHRYLTEAGHGPEHDARSGDVPADGGDPDCDRGRDWGLRARQVHLEALSKRAAGGKWFASTNGADGLARLDNGTDGMFPVRGEWHEIEFIEALVNAYRNGDLTSPRADSDERTAGEPQGAWMQTFCLPHFRVLDPDPSQILIEDIAHHLSQNVRYGGAGIRFLSVAEHSVHMARAARPEHALWALLHDASETYLHDLVRPVKRSLAGYAQAEDRIMRAVCERFGLPLEMPREVKQLDNRILIDETRQNMRPSDVTWSFGGETEPLGVTLQYWTPEQAEREFLATFAAITGRPVAMPATPAQPAGAVPDSLRALSEAATQGPWAATYQEYDDWGVIRTTVERENGFRPVVCAARVLDDEREQAAARRENRQPRICGANASLIVAAVNRLREEIASHPAGQGAGSGAEDEAVWPEQYGRLADGYGPIEEWRDWLKQANREPLSVGAIHALRGMVGEFTSDAVKDALQTAPDSTRTGQGEERLRKAVSKALHDNQFLDGWPEMVDPVVNAVLAARPAAPEAQGAWQDISTVPIGVEVVVRGGKTVFGDGLRGSSITVVDDREDLYRPDGTLRPSSPTVWHPAPTPPASSGQGGR